MPLHTDCANRIPPGCFEWIEVLGDAVQRDDELVRNLLLEMEADPSPVKVYPSTISGSPEQRKIYHHVLLLADAGLVAPVSPDRQVFRLTNAGHDFLAAIRDDTIWAKMKGASAAAGGFGLGLMRDIGIGYIRQKLTEMGVPLA